MCSGSRQDHIRPELEGKVGLIGMRSHDLRAVSSNDRNQALALLVSKGVGRGTHADQGHRIQAHEHRTIAESEAACRAFGLYVVKPSLPKASFDRARVPEAVATVDYGANVLFRDTSQLAQ